MLNRFYHILALVLIIILLSLGSVLASIPVDNMNVLPRYYTVQSGDNISTLMRKHNVSKVFLKRWNRKQAEHGFREGDVIVIGFVTEIKELSRKKGKKAYVKVNEVPSFHYVKGGENLLQIAEKYEEDISDIILWNDLFITVNLKPGDRVVKGFSFQLDEADLKRVREKNSMGAVGQQTPIASTNGGLNNSRPPASNRKVTQPPSPYPFNQAQKQTPRKNYVAQNRPTAPQVREQKPPATVPSRAIRPPQQRRPQQQQVRRSIPQQRRNITLPPNKQQLNNDPYIYHTLRPGETLYSVAQLYKVNLKQVFKWNNLRGNNNYVHPGAKVIVGVKQPAQGQIAQVPSQQQFPNNMPMPFPPPQEENLDPLDVPEQPEIEELAENLPQPEEEELEEAVNNQALDEELEAPNPVSPDPEESVVAKIPQAILNDLPPEAFAIPKAIEEQINQEEKPIEEAINTNSNIGMEAEQVVPEPETAIPSVPESSSDNVPQIADNAPDDVSASPEAGITTENSSTDIPPIIPNRNFSQATPDKGTKSDEDFELLQPGAAKEVYETKPPEVAYNRPSFADSLFTLFKVLTITILLALLSIWMLTGLRRLLASRKQKKQEGNQLVCRDILQRIMTSYNRVDVENDILQPFRNGSEIHLTDTAIISLFPADFFQKKSNRQIFLNELIQMRKQHPENAALLRAIYLLMEMQDLSTEKLKTKKSEKQLAGLEELTIMNYQQALPDILPLINHPSPQLRSKARISIIHLNKKDPLTFLKNIEQPLTSWEQNNIIRLLKNLQKTHLPDFSHLIDSEQIEQTVFALRLIREFKQKSAVPDILRLLYHPDMNLRKLAITTLGELKANIAGPTLKEIYHQEVDEVKQHIVKSFGYFATEKDIPFLEKSLFEEDYNIRLNSARSLLALGKKGNRKLQEVKLRADERLLGIINRAQQLPEMR